MKKASDSLLGSAMQWILFAVFCLSLCACKPDYTPKPSGFFRIETGENNYQPYAEDLPCQFLYSTKAKIETLQADKENENWFNITYPSFNARIYCSYLKIKPDDFIAAAEDSRKFVYRHSVKANNIEMELFSNEDKRTSGTLYIIEGNVASPLQFTLSDSISCFFRGALYFNEAVKPDSVAPVVEFIHRDIKELMESFTNK